MRNRKLLVILGAVAVLSVLAFIFGDEPTPAADEPTPAPSSSSTAEPTEDPADESESPDELTLEQALCNDLDAGLTLMNIAPRDMDPARFAVIVNDATTDECPQWREDAAVRTLLDNWGLLDG